MTSTPYYYRSSGRDDQGIALARPRGSATALSLAPHPDDPEAIAVTLRLLVEQGWRMRWAVLTSGWSGVLDEFVGADRGAKGRVREEEQREAARLFGLPEEHLTFARLDENDDGELAEASENRARLFALLDEIAPSLVLLPHKEDTNATHRLVYRWFAEWADSREEPVVALGNEDPKTCDFHPDVKVVFDEEAARWKASLLECHRSQSVRNQKSRGITFAQRILDANRQDPDLPPGHYAERFQSARWRTKS